MLLEVWNFAQTAFKIFIAGGAVLYTGMVLMALRTGEEDFRPHLDWSGVARSVEQLAVWAGVRIVTWTIQAAKSLLEILTDASADLGEWFVRQRGGRFEARVRSRYL